MRVSQQEGVKHKAGGPVKSPARQLQCKGVLHPRMAQLIDTDICAACASERACEAAAELRITKNAFGAMVRAWARSFCAATVLRDSRCNTARFE